VKYNWNKLVHDPSNGFVGLARTEEMHRDRAGKWIHRKVWKCHVCGKVEQTDRIGLPQDWVERWITPQHPLFLCGSCRHRQGIR